MNAESRGPAFGLVAIAAVGLVTSGAMALVAALGAGDRVAPAAYLAVATLAFGVLFHSLLRR
jgi:hypothetical protein